jgi:hypothetical protein
MYQTLAGNSTPREEYPHSQDANPSERVATLEIYMSSSRYGLSRVDGPNMLGTPSSFCHRLIVLMQLVTQII